MNIAIIGTGYVGLVTGTVLAEMGNDVTCVDISAEKIDKLKQGISPIYEPGLEELIKRNLTEGRLHFTTIHDAAVPQAQVIFNAVDTPSAADGSVDLTSIKAAARDVGQALAKLPPEQQFFRVIVNKSTVPVGTANVVRDLIAEHYQGDFDVVSNPEFLREGQAVTDSCNPDRIVIGDGHPESRRIMRELYEPFNAPIVFTDVQTAEMIKYASNAFLAMSISFINNFAQLCEQVGADIEQVSEGMRLDKRIGKQAFLSAGPGYGGSCFPKDVKGIVSIAQEHGVDLKILRMVNEVNREHQLSLVSRLEKLIPNLSAKKVAVWGLAFKPETDDLRDAASQIVIPMLQSKGASIHAFDPVAQEKAKQVFSDVTFYADPYEAITGADALVILTEWKSFVALDKAKIKALMHSPIVLDTRNIYEPEQMEELGFTYASIGRSTRKPSINSLLETSLPTLKINEGVVPESPSASIPDKVKYDEV